MAPRLILAIGMLVLAATFTAIERQRRLERAQIEALGITFLYPPLAPAGSYPPMPKKPPVQQQPPVVPVPMKNEEMR